MLDKLSLYISNSLCNAEIMQTLENEGMERERSIRNSELASVRAESFL
jgi:hypothetical protein